MTKSSQILIYIFFLTLNHYGLSQTNISKNDFRVHWKAGMEFRFIISTSLELNELKEGTPVTIHSNISQNISVLSILNGNANVISTQERVVPGPPKVDGSLPRAMIPVQIQLNAQGKVIGSALEKNEFLYAEFLPSTAVNPGEKWELDAQKLHSLGFQFPAGQISKIHCEYKGITNYKGIRVAKIIIHFDESLNQQNAIFGQGEMLINQQDGILQYMHLNFAVQSLPEIVMLKKPFLKSIKMTAERI